MNTWRGVEEPDIPPLDAAGWARAALRGIPLAGMVGVAFVAFLLVRLVEAPIFGMRRPVTPWITVTVCRAALWLLGFTVAARGQPMTGHGALVANHASWLDIFALNSRGPVYFVSKSEVARWPGIGLLARGTGTVFIDRDRRQARAQTNLFRERLAAGHRLLFFPEGTSTDGHRVLPFKTTLFAAFFNHSADLSIQPVSVAYHAPPGASPRHYGWWGEMPFTAHLLATLAAERQGGIGIVFHDPVRIADFPDRKALARHLEDRVRAGVQEMLPDAAA